MKVDARSERWREHRKKVRAEIVDAAFRAIDRLGPELSVREIAEEAGTAKPKIYRHFTDKADLYRAVGQQLAASLGDQLSSRIAEQRDPRAMVTAGIEAYLAVLDRTPELYRFVVSNPIVQRAGGDPVAGYTGLIAARLDELIGLLPGQQLDPVLRRPWGAAIVGLVKAAGDWWLEHPNAMDRHQLAESLTTLLLGGAGSLRDALDTSLLDTPAD